MDLLLKHYHTKRFSINRDLFTDIIYGGNSILGVNSHLQDYVLHRELIGMLPSSYTFIRCDEAAEKPEARPWPLFLENVVYFFSPHRLQSFTFSLSLACAAYSSDPNLRLLSSLNIVHFAPVALRCHYRPLLAGWLAEQA